MRSRTVKLGLAVIALGLVAGSAGAAVTTLSGGEEPREIMRAIDAHMDESYPVVRAFGADPTRARRVGTTARGIAVSAVDSASGRCVLFSDRNQYCASSASIGDGRAMYVANDCARPAGDLTISVMAPPATARAVVTRSDGSSVAMALADDVAWLDAQVPRAGEASYDAVTTLDPDAVVTSRVTLPAQLCPAG